MEMLAAFFGVVGAFSVAYAQNNTREQLWWFIGSFSFSLSNIILFIIAAEKGLSSMAGQMILFSISAFLMMYARGNKIVGIGLMVAMVVIVFQYLNVFANTFNIGIDLIPSVIAVTGAFLLSAKFKNSIMIGYILFLVADVIYIYIGVQEQMPWFVLQTVVYLFASGVAIQRMRSVNEKTQTYSIA